MEVAINTKYCPRCDEVKDISEFYKDKDATNGYRSHCKICMRASRKKYQQENPEKINKYQRKWQRKNSIKGLTEQLHDYDLKSKKMEENLSKPENPHLVKLNAVKKTAAKNCSKCGEKKELFEFQKDNRTKDGRRADCKTCKRKLDREYSSRKKMSNIDEAIKKKGGGWKL